MHLFSSNRAICCISFLHGWILFLTGVDAINDVIPVMGWLLLLTVEFMLANIWLWFRRDVAMWERITGFLTSTSLILISIQVLACFMGMGRRNAEARFYLMIVVLLVLIVVACLFARFIVWKNLTLLSNSAASLPCDVAKRKVYRITNSVVVGLLVWGVFHVEAGQGLVDYCIERLGRLDSIGEAFPLPNLVMIFVVLVVGSFLTFALLNMHRWVFAGSWIVSLIAALVVCQPLWRFERMVFRSSAGPSTRAGDAFAILCIWLMILAIRLSGNRLRRMEFGIPQGQLNNAEETLHNRTEKKRWWQRFNAHLRPGGNLIAVLLVMLPVYMSQSYTAFKVMWLGGQQQNVDVRVYRGGVATLRDITGVVMENADIDPFISMDVFREIRLKDCSQLSADVLKMVTYQSHLDSLLMLDVPSGLQDVALGKISAIQAIDVQGPGVTSSFLSALGDHQLKVVFNAQQGEISYDKRMSWWSGRREVSPFAPLEIALSYLQLHSDTNGFDGSEVNDWIRQVAHSQVAKATSNPLAHKLHVTLELSANQSSIFGELSKIEVANRCYLTIDDPIVSLENHQFGKLHNSPSLQLLSFENLLPLKPPQQVVFPKLRHLKLGTRLTREWMLWAIEQPALESLSISLAGIDRRDELGILQTLREFKSMRRLQLHGKLSPAVLQTLLELDKIESLFLNDSQITDTQLAAIAEMKGLKEFHIERVMSSRMLQMVVSDRTWMDRFFPIGVQMSDDAIFNFMEHVPDTTIYQFLSPQWLQSLVTTAGNIDSRGLKIWGRLRQQGYSLQAIGEIYASLRIHHSDLSTVVLFNGTDLTGKDIAHLANVKPVADENTMNDLNMLDEQPESGAIVLGRGVAEGDLSGNVLPKTTSFIAAGVTGQFIEKLDADSGKVLFIAGQLSNLGSLLSTGLERNVQLRLQQFKENGGQYEMNSSFRLGFFSKGDPLAGERWGSLLADTLTAKQDIRILISSLDGDRIIPTLSTKLGVDVLAIPEVMLTAEMLEWISSNKELKVVCLDPTLAALSEHSGNGEITFADLAASTVAAHRWDNILPLLRMKNPAVICTKFGFIGSSTVILKSSRLENILPEVLQAFPNVETIDAMQSVLTLGGRVPQVGSVKQLELQNALLEGTNEPLSSLAKQFPNVVSLQLSGATLPAWDIQGLVGLTSLRELNLTGCDIDDEALRSLEAMDSLRVLSLSRTAITNESLGVLATLTKLRQLNVYQTGMDADTVASLRTFLPRCKIYGAIRSR